MVFGVLLMGLFGGYLLVGVGKGLIFLPFVEFGTFGEFVDGLWVFQFEFDVFGDFFEFGSTFPASEPIIAFPLDQVLMAFCLWRKVLFSLLYRLLMMDYAFRSFFINFN